MARELPVRHVRAALKTVEFMYNKYFIFINFINIIILCCKKHIIFYYILTKFMGYLYIYL